MSVKLRTTFLSLSSRKEKRVANALKWLRLYSFSWTLEYLLGSFYFIWLSFRAFAVVLADIGSYTRPSFLIVPCGLGVES